MKLNNKLNKTALVYAVDLLAARPHSVKQLYDKLKRRGYEDEEINEAIERLLKRHYLDDTDLCQRQYQAYINEGKRSFQMIKYKLKEKGFNHADIENALAETDVDIIEYEYRVCLKLLQGHFRVSTAERQKCQAYLYRKGFSSSAIFSAVDDFLQD